MKTEKEIRSELTKLKSIVKNAEGINREDCPELSSRILVLKWVLGMKSEDGDEIRIECVD